MYRLVQRLRLLLTILVVIGISAAIYYIIAMRTYQDNLDRYNLQVTAAVATAVQSAIWDVTRTVEAPGHVYQVIRLGENENLETLAEEYGTTLEIIQIVNRLSREVTTGNGETLVIPMNVKILDPLRTIVVYQAQPGDTLSSIATQNSIALPLLQRDNPVLARRGLVPGDTVFIGLEL